MKFDYDVIVVGGGHAGCEAAAAAARLGASVLLITSDMNRIAQMSCNPAIGGIAKGQIVREIDALGGWTGIVADRTAIQFRMLNRSKGPAVWSPRAQSDRTRFIDEWRRVLDAIPGLFIYQDTVRELMVQDGAVRGVRTQMGIEFAARRVVLTCGTFLGGLMHFGEHKVAGGRISEPAADGLTAQLVELGFEAGRMKTGTPVRIDGRTINYAETVAQGGDDTVLPDGSVVRDFHKFSFLPEVQRQLPPRDCYIVHTNPECHRILRDNLDRSPLYNGDIQSIGPRYCPSIETKIVTFAERDSHQLFLEPEGSTTQEFYVNGFSSSLPWDVQLDALREVPALADVHVYRPGYAIEYDYFDPTQLLHTLETKLVAGLYFAGQICGTTGYEEAAAQGLMAGANAALAAAGKNPLVLGRDQAYIGVLIDDLVMKGVDEPYRMFTSRAEYRILLRQDDADMRLTPIAHAVGLASDERFRLMEEKRAQRDAFLEWCASYTVRPSAELNGWLEARATSPLAAPTRLIDLLRRPQLGVSNLTEVLPALVNRIDEIESERRAEITEAAEILIKYEGYIAREQEAADKLHRLEHVKLPASFDYAAVKALSTEARQKLTRIRPATLGQASRIPGVSPADVNVLMLLLGR